jgi:undecaprenyl-diphosphatase
VSYRRAWSSKQGGRGIDGNEHPVGQASAGNGWVRAAVAGSIAFLVALGALALVVREPAVAGFDAWVTELVHSSATPASDAVMPGVTALGSGLVLTTVAAVVSAVLAVRGHRAEAAFVAVVTVATFLVNDVLKRLVGRPRPDLDWAELLADPSFPSGHAQNAFVVWVALALVLWALRGRAIGLPALVGALGLAAAVGLSRVSLGVHHLTDVIGAFLAGAAVVLLGAAVVRLMSSRPSSSHAGRR